MTGGLDARISNHQPPLPLAYYLHCWYCSGQADEREEISSHQYSDQAGSKSISGFPLSHIFNIVVYWCVVKDISSLNLLIGYLFVADYGAQLRNQFWTHGAFEMGKYWELILWTRVNNFRCHTIYTIILSGSHFRKCLDTSVLALEHAVKIWDVADGEPEDLNLWELLVRGQGGQEGSQSAEGRIEGLGWRHIVNNGFVSLSWFKQHEWDSKESANTVQKAALKAFWLVPI